jgi:hypothetical protein
VRVVVIANAHARRSHVENASSAGASSRRIRYPIPGTLYPKHGYHDPYEDLDREGARAERLQKECDAERTKGFFRELFG